MWGSGMVTSPSDEERNRNPWHNLVGNGPEPVEETVESDSDESVESGGENTARGGTWGERDAGGMDQRTAMEDFEALRETLTSLSKTRSHAASERRDGLLRTISRTSTKRTAPRRPTTGRSVETADDFDEPGDLGEAALEKDDEFELDRFMKEGHLEKRKDGQSAKKVGVVWKNLTVKGTGSTTSFVRTLPDAILGTFGPDLYRIVTHLIPTLRFNRHQQMRTLINDFSGVVRDGEMMLVLGRPGSGCSTFLKAIANNRESYAEVTGDVSYGGIPAATQKKQFRGEVNYNPEDDTHFANLNVWQTLYFALMNKTKKNEKGDIPVVLEALLKIFGISHTKYTPVGDEYVRGVSGGERKRVRGGLYRMLNVLTTSRSRSQRRSPRNPP